MYVVPVHPFMPYPATNKLVQIMYMHVQHQLLKHLHVASDLISHTVQDSRLLTYKLFQLVHQCCPGPYVCCSLIQYIHVVHGWYLRSSGNATSTYYSSLRTCTCCSGSRMYVVQGGTCMPYNLEHPCLVHGWSKHAHPVGICYVKTTEIALGIASALSGWYVNVCSQRL